MGWLRIDDGFAEHRKLLALKRSERWTWLEVMTYCARQSDSGFVPVGISDILRYATPTFLRQCDDVGLLDVENGDYRVHDWTVYNPKDPSGAMRQARYRNGASNSRVTETVTDETVTSVTPPARARARGPSPTPKEQPYPPSSPTDQGREGGMILREMPT